MRASIVYAAVLLSAWSTSAIPVAHRMSHTFFQETRTVTEIFFVATNDVTRSANAGKMTVRPNCVRS